MNIATDIYGPRKEEIFYQRITRIVSSARRTLIRELSACIALLDTAVPTMSLNNVRRLTCDLMTQAETRMPGFDSRH
jgi:hypothetical protein